MVANRMSSAADQAFPSMVKTSSLDPEHMSVDACPTTTCAMDTLTAMTGATKTPTLTKLQPSAMTTTTTNRHRQRVTIQVGNEVGID